MSHFPPPSWVAALAEQHLRQHKTLLLLTGAVTDTVGHGATAAAAAFLPVPDYLAQVVFAPRPVVVRLNADTGTVHVVRGTEAFQAAVHAFDASHHTQYARQLPTEPASRFALLEFAFRHLVGQRTGVLFLVENAALVTPAGPLEAPQQSVLNTLLTFGSDSAFVKADFAAVLLAPDADALNEQLHQSNIPARIDVPPPSAAERQALVEHLLAAHPALSALIPAGASQTATDSLGFLLVELRAALEAALAQHQPATAAFLAQQRRLVRLSNRQGILAQLHPEHIPAWVERWDRLLQAGTLTQFILHGNTVDYQLHRAPNGTDRYLKLNEYLSSVLFPDREIVVQYDRATGLSFRNAATEEDFYVKFFFEGVFKKNTAAYEQWLQKLKVSEFVFGVLERYFEARLQQGQRVLFVIDYAETLVPMAGSGSLQPPDRAMLVYFQKWARNSLFVGSQMTVALITENANDLHQQLVRNPFTAELELPYPDEDARLRYIRHHTQAHPALPNYLEMSPEVLARDTAGLTIVQLRTTLAEVVRNAQVLSFKALSQRKRDVIESEAGGLLSFVETRFNLEAVAGHRYAKANLRAAAAALKAGRADVLPMGYLVNGPVGTGKTFLVSCFAAEIGVPMVELKNFRSQYVGVTEANLEKVLRLLKAMSPVAVMIDEADATLGNRGQGGDSGVSSRVFSTIASFMSNTEHRGRIIWFLLTARPDLMPIDLKRQGRAEEHIALFYPETLDEKRELLAVMLRKTKIALAAEAFPDAFLSAMQVLSGADMEAALTRAKFRAAALGLAQPTLAEVEQAFADFIPPSYPEEVEYQNLVAALECTSRELLPERYRNISRAELTAQLEELRPRLGR